MKIIIETIPIDEMRYPTVGDWQWQKNNDLHILVAETGKWRFTFLIAVHEIIEAALCRHRNISQYKVEKFDVQFEKERSDGMHELSDEAGDDVRSPYRMQHKFATLLEFSFALALGINWKKYSRKLNSL